MKENAWISLDECQTGSPLRVKLRENTFEARERERKKLIICAIAKATKLEISIVISQFRR